MNAIKTYTHSQTQSTWGEATSLNCSIKPRRHIGGTRIVTKTMS